MKTFEEALAKYLELSAVADAASKALGAIPGVSSGPMGLTPDSVKQTTEFKIANRNYQIATEAMRKFNKEGWFTKTFKKEYRAYWDARKAAKYPVKP